MNRGRAYYYNHVLKVAEYEEGDDKDYGWGGGFSLHPYAMDDESIEWWAQTQAGYFADDMRRAREYEQKREQKKAKPFWERWFGGV